EFMCAHVISIGPQAKMRIVFEDWAERKVVDVILARGVGSLRDGDTLAGGGTAASTYSKLGEDPTVGKLVIHHNRVLIVIEVPTGVGRKCLKQIIERSGARQPRAGFV